MSQGNSSGKSQILAVHDAWVRLIRKNFRGAAALEVNYKLGSNAAASVDAPRSFRKITQVEDANDDMIASLALDEAQDIYSWCLAHCDENGGRCYYELRVLGYDDESDELSVLGKTSSGGMVNLTGDRPTRTDDVAGGAEMDKLVRMWESHARFSLSAVERLMRGQSDVLSSVAGTLSQTADLGRRATETMEAATEGNVRKAEAEASAEVRKAEIALEIAREQADAHVRSERAQQFGAMGQTLITKIEERVGPEVAEWIRAEMLKAAAKAASEATGKAGA